MKKIFLFAVLFLLLSQSVFATVELKPITHTEGKYSISLPTNWEYALNYRGASLVAHRISSGPLDLFAENISVISEALPLEITAPQYYERNLVTMKEVLKELRIVSLENVVVNSLSAVKLVSAYRVGNNKVQAATLFATVGKQAYVVTLISLEDRYSESQLLFDKILGSFTLMP
ncbi:MAG: hypothetical protein ACD_62C00531G0009 [uncultured bacterium]|nr:MAG: hypothetical protein ACD_62C00531G0009 [uncultured bacterium]HLD45335.1 DcrB-related protein [bacterium]